MRPRDFSQPARAVPAVVRVLDASAAEAWESYRAMSSANCTLGIRRGNQRDIAVYILKRTGPRTEPWGTPQVQARAGLVEGEMRICCLRPEQVVDEPTKGFSRNSNRKEVLN